jgi:hypothetical protein
MPWCLQGYQGKRIDNTSVRDEPYVFVLGGDGVSSSSSSGGSSGGSSGSSRSRGMNYMILCR